LDELEAYSNLTELGWKISFLYKNVFYKATFSLGLFWSIPYS
jgi:hypothetical protein